MNKAKPTTRQRLSQEVFDIVEEAIDVEHETWEQVMSAQLRRSPMFEFCRLLRGDAITSGWDEQTAAENVDLVLRRLHPYTSDPWKEEFLDYGDPMASFLDNWNFILFPAGMFERARRKATEKPLRPAGTHSEGYCRFYSLCAYLQELAGDEAIIVPVTTFGEALGVSAQTVTTYRSLGVRAGHLVPVERAIPHRLAAKFRFVAPLTTVSTDTTDSRGMEGQ